MRCTSAESENIMIMKMQSSSRGPNSISFLDTEDNFEILQATPTRADHPSPPQPTARRSG